MNDDTREELRTLEELAVSHRFKIGLSADGEANIFGYNGAVEWHSRSNEVFTAFTTKPRMIEKFLSLPWAKQHQRGDKELRVLFHRDKFPEMAAILKLKKKRPVPKPETLEAGLKGLQEWRETTVQARNQARNSTIVVEA